tara:strand:- start:1963 stop:2481 length:519 start_codon:yes stop_codon:yes gene_type:complete
MKITKSKLEQIINEEIKKLSEADDPMGPWGIGSMGGGKEFPEDNPMAKQLAVENDPARLWTKMMGHYFEKLKDTKEFKDFVSRLGGMKVFAKYVRIIVKGMVNDPDNFMRAEEDPFFLLQKLGFNHLDFYEGPASHLLDNMYVFLDANRYALEPAKRDDFDNFLKATNWRKQ